MDLMIIIIINAASSCHKTIDLPFVVFSVVLQQK